MPKPKVIIFNTTSLDGRMDGGSAEAVMGLYYQLAASWNADAMLSGSNTMLAAFAGQDELASDPTNSSGEKELHPLAVPYLVIVDGQGRIHNWSQICAMPFWRKVIVLTSESASPIYHYELQNANVDAIVAGTERVDLILALQILNERFGIQTVRVDSGGTLNGILLRAGLVDEVSVLLQPVLVGGVSPRSLFFASDLASAEQLIQLRLLGCEQLEDGNIWLRYAVKEQSK